MENVDPVQQKRFLCSFCAATEAIAEGISASRAASDDTHWTICSVFCANVALDPLLLLYRDTIPILAKIAAEYRRGNIIVSGKNVQSHTVEDSILSIGQALAAMGGTMNRG